MGCPHLLCEMCSRHAAPLEMTSVAYAGGAGAHSAAAAERLFPFASALVGVDTFADVIRATVEGEVSYGVLPIESSLAGPVNETHDLLYESAVSIVAETSIPIRHHLVAREPLSLEDIRIVKSHPVALEQCRELLRSLTNVQAIATSTTAAAAAEVAAGTEEGEAAIVGERALRLYTLHAVARDVGDHPEAYTRFV